MRIRYWSLDVCASDQTRAAKKMTSFQPATESQTGHIGARQTRVEDDALLRGLGCYADDAAIPPGTLHAAINSSPTATASTEEGSVGNVRVLSCRLRSSQIH